jgi:hypothetical protein
MTKPQKPKLQGLLLDQQAVAALEELLNYDEPSEKVDWEENDKPEGHIYHCIKRLQKALKKGVRVEPAAEALTAFCETIDATGGVAKVKNGFVVPVGDPSWFDLGDAYKKACKALSRDMELADS